MDIKNLRQSKNVEDRRGLQIVGTPFVKRKPSTGDYTFFPIRSRKAKLLPYARWTKGDEDFPLSIARQAKVAKRAHGGAVHVGPIHSAVAGRTDHLAMDVPVGAYVIPADIVSALGEGNTASGQKKLEQMFPMPAQKSTGGAVPIMAAGGEHVIHPEAVKMLGHGDLDRGHSILDKWIVLERKKLVKTLKKLPPPAK